MLLIWTNITHAKSEFKLPIFYLNLHVMDMDSGVESKGETLGIF